MKPHSKMPKPHRRLPREHYCRNGKPKKDYGTVEYAKSYIRKHNLKGYEAYVCPICGKVHIGSNRGENQK